MYIKHKTEAYWVSVEILDIKIGAFAAPPLFNDKLLTFFNLQ